MPWIVEFDADKKCVEINKYNVRKIASGEYNQIVMFGVEKELSTVVRIERVAAKNGIKFFSKLDLEKFLRNSNLSILLDYRYFIVIC